MRESVKLDTNLLKCMHLAKPGIYRQPVEHKAWQPHAWFCLPAGPATAPQGHDHRPSTRLSLKSPAFGFFLSFCCCCCFSSHSSTQPTQGVHPLTGPARKWKLNKLAHCGKRWPRKVLSRPKGSAAPIAHPSFTHMVDHWPSISVSGGPILCFSGMGEGPGENQRSWWLRCQARYQTFCGK